MANIDLKFLCSFDENDYIKTYFKDYQEDGSQEDGRFICIKIKQENHINTIMLDKSTAIKFAKTLRTEINKIQDVI